MAMSGMTGMTGPHMSGPMWMPMSPPTAANLTAFHLQPIPVFPIACALALALYLTGVVRLHRRGDSWPLLRTASFVFGLVTVVLMTGTGIGGYGMMLFSVHMIQHMVLSMLSPIFLLLGAPITLALRTLPGGRHGARGLLLAVLHSRVARVLTSPWFTLPLFIISLYGLYLTPLFDAAMSNWWGHNWMLAHFLVVGMLFFWPILGVDPSPHQRAHGVRILELVAGMPFHAFFGIAVMMSARPVVQFFAHPPAGWGLSAAGDQNTAGGIAWGFSEVPTALVLIIVMASWARFSERQGRRIDREADRHGDRELADYNAYLSSLAARG